MRDLAHQAREAALAIQREAPRHVTPPAEGTTAATELIVPRSVLMGTRGYLVSVANQANGCYEQGWFDACAVMVRRLIETLIIEAFEANGIVDKVKNQNSEFLALSDLVARACDEPTWSLSRVTKRALPKLKSLGDNSAHSRRFNAHRHDLDKVLDDIRVVVQELVYLAKLK